MAETRSPSPEDMHWGISYLRKDLQDVTQDMRDFRKEFAQQFAEHRRETALQLRHNLMVTVGVTGVFSTIIIAFIEYRLPAG